MAQIIECVPNFSEGRDAAVIEQITSAIRAVDGVKLLDVDPGAATNRTVVTFVGTPSAVLDAAVSAVKTAASLIDMSKHTGAHPRFGATDVCPLVPVRNITMEEVVEHARELGRRLGECGITVYLYESAATKEERRNLAVVRKGEYEGLREKLQDDEWAPDFGPREFNARSGATAVGARDFLLAYNVNLNTTSTRRANAVAFDVREKGRLKREGNPLTGPIVKDENGESVWIPGKLKSVKGIGWYIEEYGICQVSLNLTNISICSLHEAFEAVRDSARSRGLRVTGSEIVGVLPLRCMLDAGRYYLEQQQRSAGVSDEEIIRVAVKSLGLDDVAPFNPREKIIDYMLDDGVQKQLVDQSVSGFVRTTASESPAPGGGSVSALLGALAAALSGMVANLSSHKRGWDHRWKEFSNEAVKAKELQEILLKLIDDDTNAFNGIMDAFGLPKNTPEQQQVRSDAIEAATVVAIEVPLTTMRRSLQCFPLIEYMVRNGLEASITDVGVAACCARTAVLGAHMNVRVNLKSLKNREAAGKFAAEAESIWLQAKEAEEKILALVEEKLV